MCAKLLLISDVDYLGELSISSVKEMPLREERTVSLDTLASIMSLPYVIYCRIESEIKC